MIKYRKHTVRFRINDAAAILKLIPSNPFLDLTGARPTSTISVVIFAAFLGIAYLGVKRKQPDQAEFFAKIVDTLHSIIMRVVTLILRLHHTGSWRS